MPIESPNRNYLSSNASYLLSAYLPQFPRTMQELEWYPLLNPYHRSSQSPGNKRTLLQTPCLLNAKTTMVHILIFFSCSKDYPLQETLCASTMYQQTKNTTCKQMEGLIKRTQLTEGSCGTRFTGVQWKTLLLTSKSKNS